MKVLITGGAGFIGSHLCSLLIENGYTVYALDDLSTGSLANISHLIEDPNFIFEEGSILDRNVVDKLVKEVDIIYHLAAVVGVNLILSNQVETIITNVHGTEIVLHYANKYKTKIIIASSSEIYGRGINREFSEDDDRLMGPVKKARWSYACTKAMDEFLAFAYSNNYSLPIIVARLFNTIGPGQSEQYGMVVPNFIKQALNNQDITVFGDGMQTRCFIHVYDVVRALQIIGESHKAVGEIYNIGSNQEISIYHLAQKIIHLTCSNSQIKLIPYSEAYGDGFEDMLRRKPNIDKINNIFGWEPKYSLEETITCIINVIKED